MAKRKPSLPKRCLAFSSLFEAELLLELMLRYWDHPFANDASYRHELLLRAAEVLKDSAVGNQLMQEVPPLQMSLISAIWYVEWVSIQDAAEDPENKREKWLHKIRKSLPSCFCNHEYLSEE